jgi:glycine/D-amino acid oxidase-like deaminating enzyme
MWPEYAATLSAESGIDVGYLRCGAIDIRERTIRNPQRELRKLRDSGGRVEVLTRDQIRQLLPDLVRSPEAGLLVEMEARIDPLATIEALRRSCHGAGVNIRENLGPIRIEPIGAGGITLVATGDIELSQPSEQRSVILAAGWESVSAALAVAPSPLPLEPVPGEAITLDPAHPEAHRGLGLALLKTGQAAAGQQALRRYLELKPDAADAKLIGMMIPEEVPAP